MDKIIVDRDRKTITIGQEIDGKELVRLVTSQIVDADPIDWWVPGNESNNYLFMCETEQWTVIGHEKITNCLS